MTKFRFPLLASSVLALAGVALSAEPWRAAQGPLMTRWANDVSPDNPLVEYPRPQMVREAWQNLNGLWEYAIRPADREKVETFDGQILVPFAVESALSGVMKPVGPDNRLWYRRQFTVPANWQGQRILLHFGAVDWDATVWVNGHEIGSHRGGYDPFTFDITKALKPGQVQEIVLRVGTRSTRGRSPRQAGARAPRHLVYVRHRHLADRLAGAGSRGVDRPASRRFGHRLLGCRVDRGDERPGPATRLWPMPKRVRRRWPTPAARSAPTAAGNQRRETVVAG